MNRFLKELPSDQIEQAGPLFDLQAFQKEHSDFTLSNWKLSQHKLRLLGDKFSKIRKNIKEKAEKLT